MDKSSSSINTGGIRVINHENNYTEHILENSSRNATAAVRSILHHH